MSVIDKKGKLFGKLNIIDLIAIVLILAVVALLGMKLTGGHGGGFAGEGQPVVYTVKVEDVDTEVYEFIKENLPSQLTASEEMVDGYVTAVEAFPAENIGLTMKESPAMGFDVVEYHDSDTVDLVFTIEGTVKDNLTSKLGTQEIRVGKTHIVKTTTFELENGVILSCERITDGAAE